jgi:hypothetical protein
MPTESHPEGVIELTEKAAEAWVAKKDVATV